MKRTLPLNSSDVLYLQYCITLLIAVMYFTGDKLLKGTVQRKLTGVLSGINRKLIISSVSVGYFF
jgi:hypothetical protein